MTFISNRDYFNEVAQGNTPLFSGWVMRGMTTVAQNAWQPIWSSTASMNFDLQDTEPTVKVASTDANDVAAGSGATAVLIEGLDQTETFAQEQITMNGLTEVESSGNWSAIWSVQVETVGASLFNEGDIWVGNGTFTAGVPDDKYCVAPIGFNKSTTFSYTVPVDKTARIVGLHVGAGTGDFQFRLRTKRPTILIGNPAGDGIWFKDQIYAVGPGYTYIEPKFLETFPVGTVISAEVKASTGTNFSLAAELLLEDVS